ncbi:hypothetical protein A9404_02600 [Halothiobacillus diazotrophicus]|uniref:DUF302 domain-containing protein n=1 Tax=Halothiobacillus diazotrophicus TaxID=1860122 RepID=A0A191ZEW2_9GAMM|nr:DUF302 domain-containing protein [Halothiobacillus diazotrophicus]ANJ66416.1 hypothetical protein A9404_02600 [Halothiobacillus diazotrophicus]
MKKTLLLALGCLISFSAHAATTTVYEKSAKMSLPDAVAHMESALKSHKFHVVTEIPISKMLAKHKAEMGAKYNLNHLDGITGIVFCNGGIANGVSNKDPELLAACPLHLTIIEKDGMATALFVRPTVTAKGSAAEPVLAKLEHMVTAAIDAGMH